MAEVFGAVASGAGLVSLAIQLAETAVKLKRLTDTARNAPQVLADHADDVETFSMILRQIEKDRVQHADLDASVVLRCVRKCQQGVARIVETTAKLETQIQRLRFMGRVVVALKQDGLQQLL